MGNYMLCRRPLASQPFHIESVHLNIYSLEELCYFLSTNLALADEAVLDPSLSHWLAEECGLERFVKDSSWSSTAEEGKAGERLVLLFARSHYFTESELKQLKMQIEDLEAMDPAHRQKSRGDALFRNRKYSHCIVSYEQVFELEETEEDSAAFQAGVYNNMGCAYARMFQGARASECFRRAYECSPAEKYRDAYLKALYLEGGSDRLIEGFEELHVSTEKMNEIRQSISEVKTGMLPKNTDQALETWIRDYHRSVDQ